MVRPLQQRRPPRVVNRGRVRPAALAAVAAGGALGAVLRWAATYAVPDGSGLAWTTSGINVSGSLALALLPAVAALRDRPLVVLALGPGLLGGFTTFSAYAEQGRGLLDDGRPVLALGHLLGTVVACLVAVHLVRRGVAGAAADDEVDP